MKLLKEKCSSLFFLAYFILGVAIFRDYGAGWDELFQNGIGWVNYVWIFGGNPYLQSVANFNKYYGPIYEICVFSTGLLAGVFTVSGHPLSSGVPGQAGILWRHFFDFSTYFVGTIYFFLICKNYFNSRKIALLGMLFFILSPRLFADSFYNSKDTVFLAFFTIAIYYLLRFLEEKNKKNMIFLSITSAVAIDVRVLALLIPFFALLFFCIDLFLIKQKKENSKKDLSLFSWYAALTTILVYVMMPYLWTNPIGNFIAMWNVFSHYPQAIPNLYRGQYVLATQLPWHYIPLWIFITTPPLYLFLFGVGVFSFFLKTKKGIKNFYLHNQQSVLFLLWFFLPIGMVILLHSNLYNAWRQMFFIYPGFLLIALSGVVFIYDFLKSNRFATLFFTGIIIVSILYTAKIMIEIHPYQNVYFNIFAGSNMNTVMQNYETDYWGVSYKKGLEYILAHDKRNAIFIAAENDPGRTNSYLLPYSERRRLVYINDQKDIHKADYYLTDFFNSRKKFPYKEFNSVTVEGAKIMSVYKVR